MQAAPVFLLLAALSLSYASSSSQVASAEATITLLQSVNLAGFSISSSSMAQGESADFIANITSLGNAASNVTVNVSILDSADIPVDNVIFSEAMLLPGESQTLIKPHTFNYPEGSYAARASAYYNGTSTPFLEQNFSIGAAPQPPAPSAIPYSSQPPLKQLSVSVNAQCEKEPSSVLVSDSQGRVSGAEVLINYRGEDGGAEKIGGETDNAGAFLFTPESAGEHRLEVRKLGYGLITKIFSIVKCAAPPPTQVPELPQPELIPEITGYRVLHEGGPGEHILLEYTIKNPANSSLELTLLLEGMPDGWGQNISRAFSLPPFSSQTVQLALELPENAVPGDYFISGVLPYLDKRMSVLTAVRVVEKGAAKPAVGRQVRIVENKRTEVVLVVRNTMPKAQRIQLVERIPKEFASDLSAVEFSVPPSRIIEPDPVVQWDFELEKGEERRVGYSIEKVVQTFDSYLGMQLEQINVITGGREDGTQIAAFFMPQLIPGGAGEASVTLTNYAAGSKEISISVGVPEGWGAEPGVLKASVPGRTQHQVQFLIRVPKSAAAGTYSLLLSVTHEGVTTRRDIPIVVRLEAAQATPGKEEPGKAETAPGPWLLAAAGAALVIAGAALVWLKKRKPEA